MYMPSHYTAKQLSELAEVSKIYVLKLLEDRTIKSFRDEKWNRFIIPQEEADRFLSVIRMRRALRAERAARKAQEAVQS
jgi:hypothetical protein